MAKKYPGKEINRAVLLAHAFLVGCDVYDCSDYRFNLTCMYCEDGALVFFGVFGVLWFLTGLSFLGVLVFLLPGKKLKFVFLNFAG